MSQDFLIGMSTAMVIAFLAIISIFLYFFKNERKQYLIYWVLGWALYCVRITFLILMIITEKNFFISYIYDSSGILSTAFILLGAGLYFNQKINIFAYIFSTACLIWYAIANMFNFGFIAHHLFPSLVVAGLFIYIGMIFWKSIHFHRTTRIIGILFFIMGLHRIDYPFLNQVESFKAFGYLLNEVLFIFTAIGFAVLINAPLRRKLSESESRYHALANTSRDMIYSIDLEGNLLSANRQFQVEFAHLPRLVLKRHISIFFPNTTFSWDYIINKIKETGEVFQTEYTSLKNNEERYFQITLSPIYDKEGKVIAINGTHHDVTHFKEKEELIQKMVYKDTLTELPNSYSLYEHLSTKISNDPDNSFAVLYIGLDQFKKINDLSGPSVGDELLKMVGKSFQLQIGNKCFVSRYGGDEFVIVTESADVEEINSVLSFVKSLFKTRWILKHQKFHLSASIGVSIYPKDGLTPEEILKNANLTLHFAKEIGRNSTLFYSSELREQREKNNILEKALYNALENNEFTLFFQPQIHTKTNRLRGFEALIRWENPAVGIVAPNDFIPLAEKSGLIVPIGDWVLNEACRVLNILHNQCNEKYCISINISPKQIQQDDFVDKLKKAINDWNIPVNYLELEITESVLIDSFDATIEKLKSIYDLGVRLSLDDFGTGYSSFNYLTRLPIHLLKIDKSFTNDIHVDMERAIFLEKLIDLVKQMKIDVLVEGVEKKEQLDVLKGWKCDYIQGFYTSKPLPFNQLFTYIEKYA